MLPRERRCNITEHNPTADTESSTGQEAPRQSIDSKSLSGILLTRLLTSLVLVLVKRTRFCNALLTKLLTKLVLVERTRPISPLF